MTPAARFQDLANRMQATNDLLLQIRPPAERLACSIEKRLLQQFDDLAVCRQVAALAARWILAVPARSRPDSVGRLRLDPARAKDLNKLGKTLRWMADADRHQGQQATDIAAKALRGLRASRLSMAELFEHAEQFRAVRATHIKQRNKSKARAAPEVMAFAGGIVATRIISERALLQLGQEAGNCLARAGHREIYLRELKQKETAFWRIDAPSVPGALVQKPLWVASIRMSDRRLMELDHPDRNPNLQRDRAPLLAFLAQQKVVVPPWGSARLLLDDYALPAALIQAEANGQIHRLEVEVSGTAWSLEIAAPGILAGTPAGQAQGMLGPLQVTSWVLQGSHCSTGRILSWCPVPSRGMEAQEDLSDEEADEAEIPRYRQQVATRFALRRACAACPALRAACATAFAQEDPLFLEDWFGIVAVDDQEAAAR
jgi:hypothetical protein